MTDKKIIQIVRKIKPKEIKHLRSHVSYRFLGSGAYKMVYALSENLVIKFSRENGAGHLKIEIDVIRRIMRLKKFRSLRKFIPKIHYLNFRNGVIIMERVKLLSQFKIQEKIEACDVETYFSKLGMSIGDLHCYNAGVDCSGRLKVIDLGCAWEKNS